MCIAMETLKTPPDFSVHISDHVKWSHDHIISNIYCILAMLEKIQ